MPRPVDQILALLRTGVKTAKELQQALGFSQPTLSRLLAGMGGQGNPERHRLFNRSVGKGAGGPESALKLTVRYYFVATRRQAAYC